MISIVIVEDQKIVRESLEASFDQHDDMQVLEAFGDASMAKARCAELHPDILLLDICTENDSSGLDAARDIKAADPRQKIVLMTGMPDVTFVQRAREIGVETFIYKAISLEEMVNIIRATAGGYGVYPSGESEGFNRIIDDLTPREMEILELICDGMSRTEIAEQTHLSESSVKSYISTILSKTGFSTTSKLAIFAVSKGFVNPRM